MNYQTEMTPMNIELLQSVLYNAQKDIPKIKVTFEFDDQQNYKKFMNKISPVCNEDEDVISNSDSEDLQEQNGNQDNLAIDQKSVTIQQYKYVEKLNRLELSIILKENYQQEIGRISKQTGVKILIVPEKLKFFGASDQDISQAKSQVHEIKTNIMISSLERYGRQVYESDYLRRILEQHGVKLGRVAQKYYYWYDGSKSNQKIIQDVLDSIFNNNIHCFCPLVEMYQGFKSKFNKKYMDVITKNNANLYSTSLDKQLNDDGNADHKIQLNSSKTQIIIHVKVKQQAEIIKHQIRSFYSDLIQFFIHYKVQGKEEIQNIKEIQKILTEKGVFWFRQEDLLVINFSKKNINKLNESNLNVSAIMQSRAKDFIEGIKSIFDLNPYCYIECLQEQDKKEIQDEIQKIPELDKKITGQYKKFDGIFVFSPKSQRAKLFVLIIEHLILKPKLFPQKPKLNETIQILDANISQKNQSNFINDTTSMIDNSQNQISMNKSLIGNGKDYKMKKQNLLQKSILKQIRQGVQLENYNFMLHDFQGNKKYDDIQQIKKGKGKFPGCQQIEKKLQEMTKRKFKPYLINVPQRYKCQLSQTNDILTVFLREPDRQQLENQKSDKICIHLIGDSKSLSVNGWLLNVNRQKIIANQYQFEVMKGNFQIIYFLKNIQQ